MAGRRFPLLNPAFGQGTAKRPHAAPLTYPKTIAASLASAVILYALSCEGQLARPPHGRIKARGPSHSQASLAAAPLNGRAVSLSGSATPVDASAPKPAQ